MIVRLRSMAMVAAFLATPAMAQVAPANPNDIMDVVRWTFEQNGCVATEDQLFEAMESFGFGTMLANNTVIRVANEPSTEIISRAPFTYKFSGTAICQ